MCFLTEKEKPTRAIKGSGKGGRQDLAKVLIEELVLNFTVSVLKAWGFHPANTLACNLCWILHHDTSFPVCSTNYFLIEISENFEKNKAYDSAPIDQLNYTKLQSF